MGKKKINQSNPTENNERNYIIHGENPRLKEGFDEREYGKWSLNGYGKEVIQAKWELCKDLYNTGELKGIAKIGVSTQKRNKDKYTIFFWGKDDGDVKENGKHIVKLMRYKEQKAVYWFEDGGSYEMKGVNKQPKYTIHVSKAMSS